MSNGHQPRTRSDLVAGLQLPPGQIARLFAYWRRSDVMLRVGMALLAALLMWAATGAWVRQFDFRAGYTPTRDIVASVQFEVVDEDQTRNQRRQARSQTLCVYENNPQPWLELRKAFKDALFQVTGADSFDALRSKDRDAWAQFLPADNTVPSAEQRRFFGELRGALADDQGLTRVEGALKKALADYEQNGLLVTLEHKLGEGSQSRIMIYDVGQENFIRRVEVEDVRLAEATTDLQQRLEREFTSAAFSEPQVRLLSQLTYHWLRNQKLPTTLRLNGPETKKAQDRAASQVENATMTYLPGDKLVDAGQPLSGKHIELLREEYRARVSHQSWSERVWHSVADLGMYIAMYVLCGTYIFFHHRVILRDLRRLATLMGLVVVTVVLSMMAAHDQWRAEAVPLILFGITVSIAYGRELALLMSAAVTLVVAVSARHELPEFIIMAASIVAAILLLGPVRSRTKLIYVGLGAAAASVLTTLGVGTLMAQPYGWSGLSATPFEALDASLASSFLVRLLAGASWNGFCAIMAGILMTGLLPFMERLFDVQTDISLLELGDAAHPLLQELVRRAPGTYNHSITVASIAEAAAEAIGANGLLVRVGAYFHDIGKMLKPAYFIENQSEGGNRHESLMPAMSTLVIIAHVKDGADLARQHRLPRSIIDFIEQHHGTTLVEYFYREATKRSEEDPDSSDVDETSFRYPGPKPLSKEAGVLMLADAAESICRSLVEPAPSRIEHVVQDLAMKRLLDGQFDECGLTLKELRVIEESLIKSLTAVYHGRVKYPDQQTA